jgi:extracellular elastinolytic metalloproteinase
VSEKTISAARALLVQKCGRSGAEFVADPHIQTAASGRKIVHFHQTYAGIPFFGAYSAVHLGDGAVLGTVARVGRLNCIPSISAADATAAALAHFRPRTDRSMCQMRHRSMRGTIPLVSITASFPLPAKPTILQLERTKSTPLAHLEFFDRQLVWVVRLPMRTASFLVLVAANGEAARQVVFCTPWSSGAQCAGPVFGFDDIKATQHFPALDAAYPPPLLLLPNAATARDWITLNGTSGNNVVTHSGNKETLVLAAAGAFGANLNAQEQSLLNAFFFCNYLHDFFLFLGFGEQEGNFQLNNAPGNPGDRLKVKVFATSFENLGKMEAHVDGEPAELKLGRAPNGSSAALHADVVIHEYAHGVSHRMVGGLRGAATLANRQSLALDEAWSDYFAITLRNHHLGANKNFTFAAWAGSKKPARSAPYDPQYNSHYGNLGKKPHDTPHGAGEIFAVALIRFNELLGNQLGDATLGNCIGWRVVVESLRQCNPANPTLLDGRQAVFRAIDEMAKKQLSTSEAKAATDAAKQAFAMFGMGPKASGPKSDKYVPTTPDFKL